MSGLVSAGLQIGLSSLLIKRRNRQLVNQAAQDFANQINVEVDPSFLIKADITLEEHHVDEVEITDHPTDAGALISDHSYKRPVEVTIKMAWSNSPVVSQDPLGAMSNFAIGQGFTALGGEAQQAANVVAQGFGAFSAITGMNADQASATYKKLRDMQDSRELIIIATGKRNYRDMLIKSLSVVTDYKSEEALYVTMTCRQVILVNVQIGSFNTAPSDKGVAPDSSGGDRPVTLRQ